MKKKIIISIFVIIILLVIFASNNSYANYQSKDVYIGADYPDNWIKNIRLMESSGQVMGLTETVNSTTLKATTDSNNIDVHMIKNTEWGAMAILSSSQEYGKKGVGTARYVWGGSGIKSTTGNISGVYLKNRDHYALAKTDGIGWVAATTISTMQDIDSRYIDRYQIETSTTGFVDKKNGDALLKWHEKRPDTFSDYMQNNSSFILRGWQGIFYYGVYGYNQGSWSISPSRACITNGEGV